MLAPMVAVAAVQPTAEREAASLPTLRGERSVLVRQLKELASECDIAYAAVEALEQKREWLAQRLDQYDRAIDLLEGREFDDLRESSLSLGQRILVLLGDGMQRTSDEIADGCGGAKRSVRVALSRMVKAGMVASVEHGPDDLATYLLARRLVVEVASGRKRRTAVAGDDTAMVLL